MVVQWSRRSYTKQEFIEAWISSRSVKQCAEKLNLNYYGSVYPTLRAAAIDCGLDESHMDGQGWNVGNSPSVKIPLEDILVKDSKYTNTTSLKKRLWSEGKKSRRCEECGIREWNGRPAPLALDHINGIRSDNRIENLRILCYNCHGQTDTFCGKNKAV